AAGGTLCRLAAALHAGASFSMTDAVPAIDERELAGVLSAIGVGEPDAWRCEPLAHTANSSATRGLWRVRSVSSTGVTSEPPAWSVVLKVVHHSTEGHPYWLSSDDPEDPMYWKREPLAYASGLPSSLGDSFRGPRLYRMSEQADGVVLLWLEDV